MTLEMAITRIVKYHCGAITSYICSYCKNVSYGTGMLYPKKDCCSPSCANSVVNNPNWRGGRITAQGYRGVGRKGLLHRAIMEKHLGRKLDRFEYVHHVNHNKLDNRLKNLQVLSASEHLKLHWAERRMAA